MAGLIWAESEGMVSWLDEDMGVKGIKGGWRDAERDGDGVKWDTKSNNGEETDLVDLGAGWDDGDLDWEETDLDGESDDDLEGGVGGDRLSLGGDTLRSRRTQNGRRKSTPR